MTEREKIIEIIKRNGTYNGRSLSFDYYVVQPDDLADALIAANFGDVKETDHRAEVAEKAGRIIQRDMARVFDVSNPRICELIANIWDLAKKQAEKELAEERKDE